MWRASRAEPFDFVVVLVLVFYFAVFAVVLVLYWRCILPLLRFRRPVWDNEHLSARIYSPSGVGKWVPDAKPDRQRCVAFDFIPGPAVLLTVAYGDRTPKKAE